MPSNLFMADTEFPQFKDGQSVDEKFNIILDYLHLMSEQFRYTLSNIGDGNINKSDIADLIKTVSTPVITVVEDRDKQIYSKLEQTEKSLNATVQDYNENVSSAVIQMSNALRLQIEDVKGNVSEISQNIDSISLSVVEGTEKVYITLSIGEDEKTGEIDMGGLVTFTSLEDDDDVTVINGAEINTGTVNGVTINGSQINCKNDNSGVLNFIDTTLNNGKGETVASVYMKKVSKTDNTLIIATANGNYGKNNHILIHSDSDIILRGRRIRMITEGGEDDEGVYINGTKIG